MTVTGLAGDDVVRECGSVHTCGYIRQRRIAAASQADATDLTGLLPDQGGFRYYSAVGSVPRKDETEDRAPACGSVRVGSKYM